MESVPRFLSEIAQPFPFFQRLIVFALFLAGAWFFRRTLHTGWKTSVLSGMFIVEAAATVCFAILLFLQLWSPWWMLLTGFVILARSAIYAYLSAERLPNLRGLVFFTCLFYLVLAEIILTFGVSFL